MRVSVGISDDDLRRRVLRVLEAFPEVEVVTDGDDIALPDEPLRHLANLLSEEVARRSGRPAHGRAATVASAPLPSGVPVTFPPPLGPLWAELINDDLLAPTDGSWAGALASNDALALAVVDDQAFLRAIVTAGPIISAAQGISELAALQRAGLSLAERSSVSD